MKWFPFVCLIVAAAMQATTAGEVSLAGKWRFSLDAADEGIHGRWFDQSLDQSINLPGILQAQGQDAEAILAQAQGDGVKAHLRDNTARAQALGIFGAPSFTIGEELFWGNDRIEQALEFAMQTA